MLGMKRLATHTTVTKCPGFESLCPSECSIGSAVEHLVANERVTSSNLVCCSMAP